MAYCRSTLATTRSPVAKATRHSPTLDLFHHRIITRYYAIWRKYHYPAGFRPGGQDRLSQALLGLAGAPCPVSKPG
jgi:predicted component of type VI protein secretion system